MARSQAVEVRGWTLVYERERERERERGHGLEGEIVYPVLGVYTISLTASGYIDDQ